MTTSIAIVPASEIEAMRHEFREMRRTFEKLIASMSAAPQAITYLTPKEVSATLRCAHAKVYDALASGELPYEERPSRGGKLAKMVKAQDAEAWWASRRK